MPNKIYTLECIVKFGILIMMRKEIVIQHLRENICIHDAKYLNHAGVKQYQALAETLNDENKQKNGLRRTIKKAFIKEYGITELEAVNIMNGFQAFDYINKYKLRKQCDEVRRIMLGILQQGWIPEDWSDKQVKVVVEPLVEKKIDDRLLRMSEKDKISQAEKF